MSRILAALERLPRPLRRLIKSLPGSQRLRGRLAGLPRRRGPGPGELRAVVYLPTWARWDVMRQRPQYLMAAFAAAGHQVYFVDPREREERVADGVTIVPSLAAVPARGVILYVHFAPVRHMIDLFEEPVIVYDILDDLTIYTADEVGMPAERRVAAHHPAVVSAAHVVLVSAHQLADTHRTEAPRLILVENGVDPARFTAPAARPEDLPPQDPDHPIVGYHGMVSYWFDFDLLLGVADALPEWEFVLVGPVDGRVRSRARRAAEQRNITLLGERPSAEIPAYVQAFDVGAVWFSVTDLTRAVSPLKLYEYLAAQVPCVSTPLPPALASAAVRTASDVATFAAELQAALADRMDDGFLERAAAEVSAATWAARLQPVLDRLDDLGVRRV